MSSKLQRRAQILELLAELDINALNKKEQEVIFVKLKEFKDFELLQQILLKELNTDDIDKLEKIAYLISELAEFEKVREDLWKYIKTPNISDSVKEMSCTLLRIFGEKIRPEDLVEYLENPVELIDAETKKLLDVALVNPEVQIDFLDFLFALPRAERITLVDSLEKDYQGDRLVNILIPILDATEDNELKEIIIKSLGNSKSIGAISALNNVVTYYVDRNLKKLAEISLKKLKIAGIHQSSSIFDSLTCEGSQPFECYVSRPDGLGNQGVVISRLSADENVQMFSVVINDTEGILDCFGFFALSETEFNRLIKNFDKDVDNIKIPADFAAKILLDSEKINRGKQIPMPYEYLAWKTLLYDITPACVDFEEKAKEFSISMKKVDYPLLVDSDIFSLWFFDRGDNDFIDEFFDEILVEGFEVNENLERKISEVIPKVFKKDLVNLYYSRLLNIAYLLSFTDEILLRDNISLLALNIKELHNPLECELFFWIMRKSVYELFLREKALFDEPILIESNIFAQSKEKKEKIFSKDKVEKIIKELKALWVG